MILTVAFTLLFIGGHAIPTQLECSRSLEVGTTIMGASAVEGDRTVSFERNGETIECGGKYFSGEVLDIVLSDSTGRQMYQSSSTLSTEECGAYVGSISDGTDEASFCSTLGFTRCAKAGSDRHEVTAPTDDSDLDVTVAYATGYGTVSISKCSLTEGNIVDLATATDDLSTLVTAVETADLADTLSGDGPFTVFAPTNDAFDALPDGLLDSLLADTAALTDVLLYHVVAGTVLSTDLMDGMVVSTLLTNATFTVNLTDGVSFVFDTGSAGPVSVDNLASNGVVHIIDTVLIPPESEEVTDSSSWYKNGEPSKDCSWVAAFTKRCGVKGCWSCATLWCQRLGFYAC
uniref:FAS1 domain-containing protein n=1 Tax=Aureoumbra lagunensis TaxID=44058 RepID=A0A7S3K1T0_9STRA